MAKTLEQHNYHGIDATVIADSVNYETGDRITTFVATFPRIILAELNTHRALSRNSASSRAIPFKKMVEICLKHPFIPIKWQKDHKGMQGTEYFDDIKEVYALEREWLNARTDAAYNAKRLNDLGVTKQLCNRLLEPFMYHTAIITATEFENFFALRAHDQAEIHIQGLAYHMLQALNDSNPKVLKPGEWHIPFGDQFDQSRLHELAQSFPNTLEHGEGDLIQEMMVKIATARCARVSYLNFDGKDDYQADIKLHDRLADMGHWSPFEHCAQAMEFSDWSGNFKGFTQYRKTFFKENKTDDRVLKYEDKY